MVRGVSGMQRTCRWLSPLGPMLLAAEGDWLTGAWFEGQKYFGRTLAAGRAEGDTPVLTLARRWLEVYFSGREPDFAVPLRPSGTPFQQEVWAALREIPYGQTTTYGAIARQMAARRGLPRLSAQAVGGAVGRNPICILVPCHRVLGADGSLTGYAGGVERKRRLLEMESPLRPAGHGCSDLFLLRAAVRPCKRQTAAPAPSRLLRPLDAPRLRSPVNVGGRTYRLR